MRKNLPYEPRPTVVFSPRCNACREVGNQKVVVHTIDDMFSVYAPPSCHNKPVWLMPTTEEITSTSNVLVKFVECPLKRGKYEEFGRCHR